MHSHGFEAAGPVGGTLFGTVYFLMAEPEAVLDSQQPLLSRILVFLCVAFAGGISGNFGKDAYNWAKRDAKAWLTYLLISFRSRFKKRPPGEGNLNGPGTAISAMHYRQLKDGLQYAKFIPDPKGQIIMAESGNTDVTLEVMERAAREYSHEASKLATQLKGKSLERTVANIKEFLYHHFQYLADTDLQRVIVLSRAWRDRHQGIDCKSYSVIAAQILLELGIPHYFARIKQHSVVGGDPNYSDHWSHVFVLIPKRGMTINTSDPSTYFVLDGVPSYDHMPPHTEIDFYPMPLEHVIMNGPAPLGCSQPAPKMPTNPIISDVEQGSKPSLIIITVADQSAPGKTIGKKEVTTEQFKQLCGLGCPCSIEVANKLSTMRHGLNGLGEPLTIGAIIGATTALVNALGPLFGNGQEKLYQEKRADIMARNWPYTNTTYGWKNFKQAPTPTLQEMVTYASGAVERLKGKIDRKEYKDSGEKRVWERYLTIYAEATNDMATELNKRLNPSGSGNGPGTGDVSRGGGLSPLGPNENPQRTATFGGFAENTLGWATVLLVLGGLVWVGRNSSLKAPAASKDKKPKPTAAKV